MNRYRFAPSPTGPLHLGNVRTALFNWLAARHEGGTFVLRIEDTDRARSTREHEESLLDDLRWLGLAWDEGALPGGRETGRFGPYRQSQRGERYAAAARRLVERGCAYPCFCRDDELEARRRAARAEGRAPHYDGRCRGLSPEARERRAAAGEPRALRFKVPGRAVVVDDVVRGEVAFGPDAAGDFVLLRANGDPTYNFACVVDDAEMGITQVLRGEDHLPNTLRQILLYGALGLAPPRFWHLPLILGPDRSKLSKRHGDFDLRRYRERGYLPRTLLNHLALLGWSAPDGREVFSPEDLVAAFDPARISRSPAVFDPARLDWIGVQQMKAAPLAEVAAAARPFVAAAGVPWEGATLERGVALLREGMSCGQDFARELPAFRPGPVAIDPALRPWVAGRERKERLAGLAGRLAALDPWQAGAISATIRELVREAGLAARELFMPVRVAATGAAEGPALPETLELLGREETVRRLRAAVEEAG